MQDDLCDLIQYKPDDVRERLGAQKREQPEVRDGLWVSDPVRTTRMSADVCCETVIKTTSYLLLMQMEAFGFQNKTEESATSMKT